MKKKFLTIIIFTVLSLGASAQKGKDILQIAVQGSIPSGEIADIVKTGFGGSLKGMYGFSKNPQHVTLEAGYNYFGVKNLPSGASAHYSSIPIYAGYRANLGGVILEGQTGLSVNQIAGSGSGGSASDSRAAFGWAVGAGYVFKALELGVRYQSSEANDDTFIIRFIGIRLGYNFTL